MKNRPQILVYVTSDRQRVLSGSPLTLYLADQSERVDCVNAFARTLHGEVLQLTNGDYAVICERGVIDP